MDPMTKTPIAENAPGADDRLGTLAARAMAALGLAMAELAGASAPSEEITIRAAEIVVATLSVTGHAFVVLLDGSEADIRRLASAAEITEDQAAEAIGQLTKPR